jgi:hypothetical protein
MLQALVFLLSTRVACKSRAQWIMATTTMDAKARLLWRRHDVPGHEFCELLRGNDGWSLNGNAVFAHERLPCQLRYDIALNTAWVTISAIVSGQVGDRAIKVSVNRSPEGTWTIDGIREDAVAGCFDIDLNFSPSTNCLPIRRLSLGVGEKADVSAAWLRFPSFTLERLDQSYRRIAERTYVYKSATGFTADLEVTESGLPVRYGEIWSAEI